VTSVALPAPPPSAARALCAHCGLPAGTGSGAGPHFCCGGCALAFRIAGGSEGHGGGAGLLVAVGVGAFLAMNVMMLSFVLYSGRGEADRAVGEAWVRWALLLLATPALFLLGAPFLTRGVLGLREKRIDTDLLVLLGVGAAYTVSLVSVLRGSGPLFLDTAMGILLFVTVGRYLEASVRARTTDALAGLLRQMPETARRVSGDAEEDVPIGSVARGDLLRVRPGERIPADGVIVDGEAAVSEAEVSGESLPVARARGDRVVAGTLSLDGALVVRVDRVGADTTLARLVRLVEEARAAGYPLGRLVDRVSRAFVPAVVAIALGTLWYWARAADAGVGLMNALCVLLIACPCAIGIATPLAAAAAAGRAAGAGVLVRSGEAFERLARARRAFFDKTGTLTQGRFVLRELRPAPGTTPDALLATAAALERSSEHPLARALVAEADARSLRRLPTEAFHAHPGRGVEGRVDPGGGFLPVRAGTAGFVDGAHDEGAHGRTLVHVSVSGAWVGALLFEDALRAEARRAVDGLRSQGVEVEVLSGDRPEAVAALVATLPGVAASGSLTPEQKLARIQASVAAGEHPVMVGDGINDGPALSAAGVGVTLDTGTDLAREVADVTVLGADLGRLPWVMGLARAALRTAVINLAWAFGYNLVGVGLAVAGLLHPLFGAVAMIASSVSVALFSQRLGRYPLPGAEGR